jgi:hypothetical protein
MEHQQASRAATTSSSVKGSEGTVINNDGAPKNVAPKIVGMRLVDVPKCNNINRLVTISSLSLTGHQIDCLSKQIHYQVYNQQQCTTRPKIKHPTSVMISSRGASHGDRTPVQP